MFVHPTTISSQRPIPANRCCPANRLDPGQRQRLALEALAGSQPLSQLADLHDVSRKFVYQQAGRAQQALDDAFTADADEQQVLFTVRVTKSLLRQIVLGLILLCHSSFRGVVEFFTDVLGWPLSLGTVHNIVQAAVPTARVINNRVHLSAVRIGAHDEIFQSQLPVLVGVDADSSYCYLLSQEQHRDGDTWAVRLLELKDRGFAPEATVADFGAGLRAGQKEALAEVPCRGDVFHALYEAGKVVRHLESLAYQAMTLTVDLQRQLATPGKRRDRHKQSLVVRLRNARQKEAQALLLYDEVSLLVRWLREDILAVAGPEATTRRALYDFVVEQLQQREAQGPQGLAKLRKALVHQRQPLLAFAVSLDETLAAVARGWEVPVGVVYALWQVQALPMTQPQRWQREAVLRQQLGARFEGLSRVLAGLAESVVRASSVVENLNSRLRGYFFLRRELGEGYLSLLQFFLNHRRFVRSQHPERVGKSPAELLTGQPHPHWLEMLGYQRSQPN
jgi:hypothetical protein